MSLRATPAVVNRPSVPAASYTDRFGEDAAGYGCTAIPHVVIKHHRRMDMTYGEWDLLTQLFSFKWTDADPYPSIATLADRLATGERQVQALIASAQHKGFLRVTERPGHSNAYDLSPVVEKATQLEELQRQGVQKTCTPPHAENLHPKKNHVPKKNDNETIPPTPQNDEHGTRSATASTIATSHELHGERKGCPPPSPEAMNADTAALWAAMSALSDELGDDTPAASVSRARRLMEAQGIPLARFLALMQEARALTLRYAANVYRTSARQPGRKNLTPYFFTTLASLLAPPPARDRRPGRPPGRRGRRSPAPLTPINAPPPSAPPSDAWGQVCEEIRDCMTAENYTTWLLPALQLTDAGDVVTVGVPNDFHAAWMERLRRHIDPAASRVRPGLQLTFVVQACTGPSAPLDQAL